MITLQITYIRINNRKTTNKQFFINICFQLPLIFASTHLPRKGQTDSLATQASSLQQSMQYYCKLHSIPPNTDSIANLKKKLSWPKSANINKQKRYWHKQHCVKCRNTEFFSGPYFPVFGHFSHCAVFTLITFMPCYFSLRLLRIQFSFITPLSFGSSCKFFNKCLKRIKNETAYLPYCISGCN